MALDSLRDRVMLFLRRTLLWIVGIILVLLAMVTLLAPLTVAERLDSIAPVIRSLLAILLGVGFVASLYMQLRRRSGPEETGLMVRTSGAITQVDIESTRERILHAVRSLPDIVSAKVEVRAVRGKADIELNVVVGSDEINVPKKQKEIDRALKQVVNKQLGLHMANRPRMHIRFDPKTPPPPEKPVVKGIDAIAKDKQEMPAEKAAGTVLDVVAAVQEVAAKPADEKPEPQPDSKPAGGLFGGFRLGHAGDDDASVAPEEPEEPADEEVIEPVAVKGELLVDEPAEPDNSQEEEASSASLADDPFDDLLADGLLDDDSDTKTEEDPDSKM